MNSFLLLIVALLIAFSQAYTSNVEATNITITEPPYVPRYSNAQNFGIFAIGDLFYIGGTYQRVLGLPYAVSYLWAFDTDLNVVSTLNITTSCNYQLKQMTVSYSTNQIFFVCGLQGIGQIDVQSMEVVKFNQLGFTETNTNYTHVRGGFPSTDGSLVYYFAINTALVDGLNTIHLSLLTIEANTLELANQIPAKFPNLSTYPNCETASNEENVAYCYVQYSQQGVYKSAIDKISLISFAILDSIPFGYFVLPPAGYSGQTCIWTFDFNINAQQVIVNAYNSQLNTVWSNTFTGVSEVFGIAYTGNSTIAVSWGLTQSPNQSYIQELDSETGAKGNSYALADQAIAYIGTQYSQTPLISVDGSTYLFSYGGFPHGAGAALLFRFEY